ncbi:hypothetical protein [Sulfuracidifex tepidarius]|nr:hypothetical protein [Sulfuracidifex tepidarius]
MIRVLLGKFRLGVMITVKLWNNIIPLVLSLAVQVHHFILIISSI